MLYRITNRVSGHCLGVFEGVSEVAAIEAMHIDMGYRDSAHAADVLERTVAALRNELSVTEARGADRA